MSTTLRRVPTPETLQPVLAVNNLEVVYSNVMLVLRGVSLATVLCGEISLGSAIVADQWVSAHESLGRNPPTPSTAA